MEMTGNNVDKPRIGRPKGAKGKRSDRIALEFMRLERERIIQIARARTLRTIKTLLGAAGLPIEGLSLEGIDLASLSDPVRLAVKTALYKLELETQRLMDVENRPIKRRNRKKVRPAD